MRVLQPIGASSAVLLGFCLAGATFTSCAAAAGPDVETRTAAADQPLRTSPPGAQATFRNRPKASVALAAATTGEFGVAVAQRPTSASAETTNVAEIIVTARKREELAQEVPVAVTTFSGAQLENAHIETPVDLARFVPSMSVENPVSSPAAAQFSLRGQKSSDVLLTLSDPVGLYKDFVTIPHPAGTNLGLVDLSRIEVLKGPQGTLYGRNTTGGAINIITRGADYQGIHGYVSGELGDFKDRKIAFAINFPIVDNMLSVRLVGQAWTRNGYGKSITTGQDIGDDHDDRFARLSVRFDPTANFTSSTKVEYDRADQHGMLNAFEAGLGRLASTPGPYNAAGRALGLGDIYKVGIDVRQNVNVKSWHAVEDMIWSFADNVKLRSITGYHHLSYFQNIDPDGSIANIIAANIGDRLKLSSPGPAGPYPYKEVPDQKYAMYSQEFALSGRLFNRLDWLMGVFGSKEDGSGGQPNTFLSGTTVTGVLLDKLTKKDWGVFTQNDWRLSDRISLTLGARYSEERSSASVASLTYNSTIATGFPFKCAIGPTAFAADVHDCTDIVGHEQANGWSYLVSFNFKISPSNLLYIKTSRGFRGGALQQRTPSVAPAKPEFATDYEIGSKNEFLNHRAHFNIYYYHTNYTNKQEQASIIDPTFGITSVISNAARAKIDGVEADGSVNPLNGLTLTASFSYLKSKYTDYPCPVLKSRATFQSETAGLLCPVLGAPAGPPYTYQSLANGAGLAFPDIPEWQYTLGVRYEHELGRGVAAGQLDYAWTGKRTVNALNDITFTMPPSATKTLLENIEARQEAAYGLLNLRLDYTLPERQITVGVFATNLAGKRYATQSFWFNVPSAGLGVIAGNVRAPRMWGVTLRKAFGGVSVE